MIIIKNIYKINNGNLLNKYINLDCSEIAFGNEGCVYISLNKDILEWKKVCINAHVPIRFLTPIVPDVHMDELYKQIRILAEGIHLKVTFNDYGLLFRCKKLIEDGEIIPVLGRIMTRSIIDCNWTDKLLENEDEYTKDFLNEYSYNDNEKKNFIKEFRIKEVEVNYHQKKLEELRNTIDIPIVIHDNHLLSVGRVCFSAKYQELKLPECVRDPRCSTELDFSLDKKWSKKNMSYETPDASLLNYMNELYLQGNIVYRNLDINAVTEMSCIDAIINCAK